MSKIYLVMKKTYGDFDIPIETPVLASENEELIDMKVGWFNDDRSKEDLENEVKYSKSWVKLVQ